MYTSLHNHSSLDIFDAICIPKDLIVRAKELGMKALGISNHGTTTGLVSFYKECNEQNIKPILGIEMYYTPSLNVKDRAYTFHICLYAKSLEGYRNILKLTTEGTENFYYTPRIDFNILSKYSKDVICTTACLGGILYCEDLEKIMDLFGDDMYGEIHSNTIEDQKGHNNKILELFDREHIIVATDSHYIKKEDSVLHRQWKGLNEDSKYFKTDDFYLQTEYEIKERLYYIGEDNLNKFFENSNTIVDKCNVEIPFGGMHYPVIEVLNNKEEVLKICRVGWQKKIIDKKIPNKKEYLDRFLYEISILEKVNYFDYFLLMHDTTDFCDKEGIKRGVGRGSVAGSLVAYLMDLTRIDPVKYNLAFERFANLERVTVPDIDTDVQTSRRQDVINRIKERFGYDKVFNVRTIGYLSDASATKRAGQILKIDHKEVNAITKKMTSVDSIENVELRTLAKKLMGIAQSYGTHPSAIMVFPSDPTEWCAIERNKDELVVAIDDFHNMEDQGLLKLDILGLATLDIIDEIEKSTELDIDLDNLPLDDEKAIKMLREGDTLGMFQIESYSMTNIVKQMHVQSATDLFHVVALGRPGPLDSGMVKEFLDRRNKLKPVTYLHPKLEPILKKTDGIIVYQEQIMEIVQVLCGYTLGQADVLRRLIGRKEVEKVEKAMNEFIDSAIMNGVDRDIAIEIANQIRTFALYGFNLGHSAAYGYCAYQTAYLKANYPEHFFSAFINVNKELGKEDKILAGISYMSRNGIKFKMPTWRSKYKTSVIDGTVYIGYSMLKGIGNHRVNIEDGSFINFMEKNPKANKGVVTSLIKAGIWEGCRDLMLRQLVWYKDGRKSKGELPLNTIEETEYDLGCMEREVMSYCPHEILNSYDLTLCDDCDIIGGEVTKIDFKKTKKGNPMAFINIRDYNIIRGVVCFDEVLLGQIKKGDVRIFKVDGTMIKQSVEAKRM